MKIYVDNDGCIKDVNSTTNPNLIEIKINDKDNPFADWNELKICCYKVVVDNGVVTSMTPYIDSRLIDMFDKIGGMI